MRVQYLRLPGSTSIPELRRLMAEGWALVAWDHGYLLARH